MAIHPTYPLVPVLSALGAFLVLVPLPWQLQSWNTGICMTIIWTATGCIVNVVNSVVWKDNVVDWAPVWCDISAHLQIGGSIGIPAASFTIVRRLFKISRMRGVATSKSEKRKELLVDLLICLGLPSLVMSWCIIIQGHRYVIFEHIGCILPLENTPLFYVLVLMWPLLLGLCSTALCPFILVALKTRRKEMNSYLNGISGSCSEPSTRYTRLALLSMMDVVLTVPLSIFVIVLNALKSEVHPYPGWAFMRLNWEYIPSIPAPTSDQGVNQIREVARWFGSYVYVFCALVVFLFFGLSEEVKRGYIGVFSKLLRICGVDVGKEKHDGGDSDLGTMVFATSPGKSEGGVDLVERRSRRTLSIDTSILDLEQQDTSTLSSATIIQGDCDIELGNMGGSSYSLSTINGDTASMHTPDFKDTFPGLVCEDQKEGDLQKIVWIGEH